jgi:hypothetical protein
MRLMRTKLLITSVLVICSAQAKPVELAQGVAAPCAILHKFDGEVQILDSNRSTLLQTVPKSSIPCGGWLSVRSGSAAITHRQGYVFHIGADSFLQIFDHVPGKQSTGEDQIALFKGKLIVEVENGSDELRVLTTTGRARLSHGTTLITFAQATERMQVVSIDRKATLENRFEPTRKITVSAGEVTSIDFDTLRVVPETPRAVTIASLREVFADFTLEKRILERALFSATRRGERKFASEIKPDEAVARAPAGLEFKDKHYERYRPKKDDPSARAAFVGRYQGAVRVKAEAPRPKSAPRVSSVTREKDHEKEKLIEELSNLEVD